LESTYRGTNISESNEAARVPAIPPILFGTGVSLQKWEGCVSEIEAEQGIFRARLVSLTKPEPDEEAEFEINDISDEDRELLAPGAIFYWNIVAYQSPVGQRTKQSIIRFKRLHRWDPKDLKKAESKASLFKKVLFVDAE